MKIDFLNKTALITGATRGIGKAVADVMIGAGANLILTGTKKSEINKLNKLNKENGIKKIKYIHVDFSNKNSTSLFLKKIKNISNIDICVNNAGVNKVDYFEDTSLYDLNWSTEINLNAQYKILKLVGPKMIKNSYGRIVNISSIWGVISRPGRSIYTINKNAVIGLTKALAVEWGDKNILVNSVSPGFTLTELTKKTNTSDEIKELSELIPLKRMAQPHEIANLIAFLCSDKNTYISGQNIIIDGGYTNV